MEEKNKPFLLEKVSIRLVQDLPLCSDKPIRNPRDAVELLGAYMCELDREVICVVNIRSDGMPINCHFASMGAINYALAHPRELFKSSILSNATNMLLIHNHPSRSILPSKEDTRITNRMIELCELIGIPLLDHVIVGRDNGMYFSFKEKKILPEPTVQYEEDYEKVTFPIPTAAERGKSR